MPHNDITSVDHFFERHSIRVVAIASFALTAQHLSDCWAYPHCLVFVVSTTNRVHRKSIYGHLASVALVSVLTKRKITIRATAKILSANYFTLLNPPKFSPAKVLCCTVALISLVCWVVDQLRCNHLPDQ